jgi:hypothetical protein
MSKTKHFIMDQLVDSNDKLCGAKGDDIVDGFTLARDAWGEQCQQPNSGLTAFAYLWRRFGPPWRGGDPHKDLVSYTLTTKDTDVFLWITPSGSSLDLAVGYLTNVKIRRVRRRLKMPADWRTGSRIQKRVNQALFDALKELERPVRVRDIAINIFGRCDYGRREAKESPYAGYPVPKEAMDAMLAEDAEART